MHTDKRRKAIRFRKRDAFGVTLSQWVTKSLRAKRGAHDNGDQGGADQDGSDADDQAAQRAADDRHAVRAAGLQDQDSLRGVRGGRARTRLAIRPGTCIAALHPDSVA
jgi:hypothetical protein